jgi:ankyrin repeat protein
LIRSYAHADKREVSIRPRYPNDPRYEAIDDLSGNDQAAFTDATSQPYQFFDNRVVASANNDISSYTTFPGEEYHHNDGDLDLTLLKEWKLDGENLEDLFQVSRTGELSPSVLPMLHRASNNLLSWREANSLVDLIIQGSDRRVFNALISTRSPATQAIARSLLPFAMRFPDLELVRSLLDTGVSPDAPVDHALRTTLQFAVAECNSDERISDLVQLLLEYGARVNLPWAEETSSPLVYAAGRCHSGAVQLLLAAGADVNAHASAGQTTALQAVAKAPVGVRPGRSAAEIERLEIAQLLLSAGADVNAYSKKASFGETALQAAVRQENVTLVQLFLSHGADVNARAIQESSYTALERAACLGNLGMIDLLLSWGASDIPSAIGCALDMSHGPAAQALALLGTGLNGTDDETYRRVSLRAAVQSGDHYLIRGLVESNVDVDAPAVQGDTKWTTALQEAVMKGRVDLVNLLVTSGADVNAPATSRLGGTALQNAAREGNIELVRLLLDAGADVDATSSKRGMMALAAAAYAMSPAIVRLLLDAGADTFEQGPAAITEALDSGCLESVTLIVDRVKSSGIAGCLENFEYYTEYGIDPELMSFFLEYELLSDFQALAYAVTQRDFDLVKVVLDLDADVNDGQHYDTDEAEAWVLEMAVTGDELEILQLLLEHGANSLEKARALQAAAYKGALEAVEVLIDAGADVNASPTFYSIAYEQEEVRTALQAAAQQGHLDVVRLLLERGAEVERSSISEDEEGTALQFAAIAGSIVIVNELIQRGANVNAAPLGENGRTALEGAAEHGRLDMVQLLLNLEAEVQGSRALQFARKEGHDGVAMLLLQNGFEDDVRMSG